MGTVLQSFVKWWWRLVSQALIYSIDANWGVKKTYSMQLVQSLINIKEREKIAGNQVKSSHSCYTANVNDLHNTTTTSVKVRDIEYQRNPRES